MRLRIRCGDVSVRVDVQDSSELREAARSQLQVTCNRWMSLLQDRGASLSILRRRACTFQNLFGFL